MDTQHTVGSYQAKTRLPSLLSKVAKGLRITITKHGVPVAQLVPYEVADKPNPSQAIKELKGFRDKHPLPKGAIRAMIDEGRRF